jgi:hypothetical protein
MLKTTRGALGIVVAFALLVAASGIFIVDQTQQVLVLRLGNARNVITTPGLHYAVPWLDQVLFFDKRVLHLSASEKEVIASDQKRLLVTAYAKYRIVDPLRFFQSVRDEQGLRTRLGTVLDSSLRQVLGSVPMAKLLTEEIAGVNVGKLILSPTRTFAPVAKAFLSELRPQIHGMVHCSGGAQTKVLHFIDGAANRNLHVIKDNLFSIPPLFKLIQEQSGTSWQEMYKVFNMGHRLEVYLDEQYAQRIIEISQSFGIDAQIIGRVEAAESKKVTIKSEFGEYVY